MWTGEGPKAGSLDHSNAVLVSMNFGEFLVQMWEFQLLKTGSAVLSSLKPKERDVHMRMIIKWVLN